MPERSSPEFPTYPDESSSTPLQAKFDLQRFNEDMPPELPPLYTLSGYVDHAGGAADDIEPYDLAAHPDPTGETVIAHLLQADVDYVLSTLEETQEKAIRGRVLEGKTYPEIGNELGATRGQANWLAHKALKALQHPNRKFFLQPYAEQPTDEHRLQSAETDALTESIRKSETARAKGFIHRALLYLPSDDPRHVQRYAQGHREVLERERQQHRAVKDRYLLTASHSSQALALYRREADQIEKLSETIDNIREGRFPVYTFKDTIEIEITNASHEMQNVATRLAECDPESTEASQLSKRQTGLVAYHKELILAQRAHSYYPIFWDESEGDWKPGYKRKKPENKNPL